MRQVVRRTQRPVGCLATAACLVQGAWHLQRVLCEGLGTCNVACAWATTTAQTCVVGGAACTRAHARAQTRTPRCCTPGGGSEQEYLDLYEEIPFKVLRFLFTEINYGGRVTDDKDRRLMNNLITNFCGPDVLQPGYRYACACARVQAGWLASVPRCRANVHQTQPPVRASMHPNRGWLVCCGP